MRRSLRLTAGSLVLVLIALAAWPGAPAAAQGVDACPQDATLALAAPRAGAPTTLGVTVAPPLHVSTASDRTGYQLHYFVDGPAVEAGEVIPTERTLLASHATKQDVGPLTPGLHEVTVVLALPDGTACAARQSVEFIVGQSSQQPGAPKAGSAGLADSGGSALIVVLIAGAAVAVVVGARFLSGRK